jgi:hypothetical protein
MRVTIRPKTYRGREGFTVSWSEEKGWPQRVFVGTRKAAEEIRDAVKLYATLGHSYRKILSEKIGAIMRSEAR